MLSALTLTRSHKVTKETSRRSGCQECHVSRLWCRCLVKLSAHKTTPPMDAPTVYAECYQIQNRGNAFFSCPEHWPSSWLFSLCSQFAFINCQPLQILDLYNLEKSPLKRVTAHCLRTIGQYESLIKCRRMIHSPPPPIVLRIWATVDYMKK